MSRRIVLKENGKFAYWSTIIDDWLLDDVTLQEIIDYRIREETEDIIKTITEIGDDLKAGKKPRYYRELYDYKELDEWRILNHGE